MKARPTGYACVEVDILPFWMVGSRLQFGEVSREALDKQFKEVKAFVSRGPIVRHKSGTYTDRLKAVPGSMRSG